jgi:hypothetical protein
VELLVLWDAGVGARPIVAFPCSSKYCGCIPDAFSRLLKNGHLR